MSDEDGGYSENQLITIEGYCFVCRITGAWKDGRYIGRKEFTDEMEKALNQHHANTLKDRTENIGG